MQIERIVAVVPAAPDLWAVVREGAALAAHPVVAWSVIALDDALANHGTSGCGDPIAQVEDAAGRTSLRCLSEGLRGVASAISATEAVAIATAREW
jgi:hypothetical protein